MIIEIKDKELLSSFALGFLDDLKFSDPKLLTEERIENYLIKGMDKKDHFMFGVYREALLIGVFNFLIIKEEKYIEMLVGLSKENEAYIEILTFLKKNYSGYMADFVYNPRNYLLNTLLKENKAKFEIEQQKMVLQEKRDIPSSHKIVSYEEKYRESYSAMHISDIYWNAEKVIGAQDKFHIFLALEENKVVGYIDVTYSYEENEPYHVYVLPEYRNRGIAKALLTKAIQENGNKKMMLLVDIDNEAAIHTYETVGFVKKTNEKQYHCPYDSIEAYYYLYKIKDMSTGI